MRTVVVKKRMKMSPQKQGWQKFTLKEILKIFYDTEKAKDKMVETDPDLERSTIVFQELKRYSLISYTAKIKRASTCSNH